MPHLKNTLLALALVLPTLGVSGQLIDLSEATSENKPWTRWWWHGSAVTEEEITRELESFAQIGIGGVEITPIYGVKGEEQREKDFLSDEWLALIEHAGLEAKRLGMQMDIVPGTGWRLGHELVPENERAVELELHRTESSNDGSVHYSITPEPSGERVKRPAPGGSGYTIDMLNREAVANYLDRFYQTFFSKVSPDLVRAVFHDSWEYETNWSHGFESELIKRKRFSAPQMYSIFHPDHDGQPQDSIERWRYDYRQTMDELLLENFSDTWSQMTHTYGLVTRNQAHGSVANLLDVYAKTDIPETEIFGDSEDFLMHKFASSAAHVTKKRLVSAESFTWLSEHWTSDLAKIKRATDYLFLCGINHLFYHGTAYSPEDAAWPGWVFYASTQVHDRNPIWNHLPALNDYITRCQMILQSGTSYSDVYLYSPIADPYSESGGSKLRQNIDGRNWFKGTGLETSSQELWDRGVHFDFISDRQIRALAASVESTPTIILPILERIPVATVEALVKLAQDGVTVLSLHDPQSWEVPGYGNVETRQAELDAIVSTALEKNQIRHESIDFITSRVPDTWQGTSDFRAIRRVQRDGTHSYFIVNRSDKTNTVSIPSPNSTASIIRLDPWTGQQGKASPNSEGVLDLSLNPYESAFLHFAPEGVNSDPFLTTPLSADLAEDALELSKPWTLTFLEGGPELPDPIELDRLVAITDLDDPRLEKFAGLMAYTIEFSLSDSLAETDLLLELGSLASSAEIFVNDTPVGTSIRSPYILRIPGELLESGENSLRVEIATLADNRIRHLDKTKTPWRIFNDINFVNIDYRPFDASDWEISPYGLMGPVSLTPIAP